MKSDVFEAALDLIGQNKTPRLWSFLVTIFGDLAQDAGQEISGTLLSAIVHRMGIKPDTLRVALHRLRKDGWIDAAKRGRRSSYFLTPLGQAETRQASPRVYGTMFDVEEAWLIIGGDRALSDSWYPVAPSVWMSGTCPQASDFAIFPLRQGVQMPTWMMEKLYPQELISEYEAFYQNISALSKNIASFGGLSELERAILRVALIHEWRRIVLRSPSLPSFLHPRQWRGKECQNLVSLLHTSLAPVRLSCLEDNVTNP